MVVHHGGAGTTACGLLNGKPTTIVPFFGEYENTIDTCYLTYAKFFFSSQPFWGDMVAAAGAGPKPIPIKALDRQILQEAISFCLSNEASEAAGKLAQKMRAESGVSTAVSSFHRHLHPERLSCDLIPDRPAVWIHSKSERALKLSKTSAEILIDYLRVDRKDLKMSVKRSESL